MSMDSFQKKYQPTDEEYTYPGEYLPTIRDIDYGKSRELLPHAHSCVSIGTSEIYATELSKRTKIFTKWDPEHYYLGKPGDFMAVSLNDHSDVYIIERSIFSETYDKI